MKYIIAVIALCLSQVACAQKGIELIYAGVKFEIPSGFSLVADAPGDDNILIFRYGQKKGERYLAFTDMSSDASVDYGCNIVSFYDSLFSDNKDASCNKENLKILSDVFVNGRDVEVWEKGQFKLNLTSGKDSKFVFVTGPEGKILKIDTDFLSKSDLKAIFDSL